MKIGSSARGRTDRQRRDQARPHAVLFLTTATKPPLGADVWVLTQVIRSLDKHRHDVHVWLPKGSESDPTPAYRIVRDIGGLHAHEFRAGDLAPDGGVRKRLRAGWRAGRDVIGLLRLIRRQRISFIHVADRPRDALLGVLVAKVTRATSVVHCNVAYGEWMSRPLKWALRRADALVAVSEFVAGTLVASGRPADRVHVVLNAIDVDRWVPGRDREETRRELGLSADTTLVLSVCRLFVEKGPADLIRACAAAHSQVNDLQLVIAGIEGIDGATYRTELETLVSELGVADMVDLVGWRADIPQLMAAADIYAMPSNLEPFGLVFAEAMAMAVPVVGLDNGGTPEVVDNGATGLLSAKGDLDGLIANLSKLLVDPELRRTMGDAGRRRVLDRFTAGEIAVAMAGVYDRLNPQGAPSATQQMPGDS